MKRFRFSLAALLTVRLRAEETIQRELAEKNREIGQAQSELKSMEMQMRTQESHERKERGQVINIVALRTGVAYRHTLKVEYAQKGRQIARLRQEAEVIRKRLIAATKQRRAIEILRENRYRTWHDEARTAEQDFVDDVSQKAFIRARHKLSGNEA